MIPFDNIISLGKKVSLIFDTSISIITKKGEVTFTSFIHRDDCLEKLTKLHNKEEIISPVKKDSNKEEVCSPLIEFLSPSPFKI